MPIYGHIRHACRMLRIHRRRASSHFLITDWEILRDTKAPRWPRRGVFVSGVRRRAGAWSMHATDRLELTTRASLRCRHGAMVPIGQSGSVQSAVEVAHGQQARRTGRPLPRNSVVAQVAAGRRPRRWARSTPSTSPGRCATSAASGPRARRWRPDRIIDVGRGPLSITLSRVQVETGRSRRRPARRRSGEPLDALGDLPCSRSGRSDRASVAA